MRIINKVLLTLYWIILVFACRKEEYEAITPDPTINVPEADDSTQVVPQSDADVTLVATTNSDISILTTFNNQLIVSGWFTTIEGIEANGIAAFDGTNWFSLGDGLPPNGDPVFQVAGLIEDIQEFNGELYVNGQFNVIGGVHSPNLARWDGSNWKAVGQGIDYGGSGDFVSDSWWGIGGYSMEIFNEELYIGGGSLDGQNILVKWNGIQLIPVIEYPDAATSLDMIAFQNTLYGAVQLGATYGLARFDGIRWTTVPQQYGEWEGMEVYQEKLYGRHAVWDGSQIESAAYPINNVYRMDRIGDQLFMLGGNDLNDDENPSVFRWDGSNWYLFYEGVEGQWLSSLVEFKGNIYLGYSQVGGPEHSGRIAMLE